MTFLKWFVDNTDNIVNALSQVASAVAVLWSALQHRQISRLKQER